MRKRGCGTYIKIGVILLVVGFLIVLCSSIFYLWALLGGALIAIGAALLARFYLY